MIRISSKKNIPYVKKTGFRKYICDWTFVGRGVSDSGFNCFGLLVTANVYPNEKTRTPMETNNKIDI